LNEKKYSLTGRKKRRYIFYTGLLNFLTLKSIKNIFHIVETLLYSKKEVKYKTSSYTKKREVKNGTKKP